MEPGEVVNVFCAHSVHFCAFVVEEYVPGLHKMHELFVVMYVPGWHTTVGVTAQGLQMDDPAAEQ